MSKVETKHSGIMPASLDTHDDLGSAKLSTRLAFFIAGFGLACWAPLVPFAKARLGAGEAELGSILLFLGIGSVLGMPAAGYLAGRFGNRVVVVFGALGVAICLPLLAMASSPAGLSAALFGFGAALGGVDVAANMHGTEVQERAGQPLMSGFHGLFSVGGLVGAAAGTLALSLGMSVTLTASIAGVVVLACVCLSFSGFLKTPAHAASHPAFVVPHGVVVLIGVMTGLVFLAEGAVLDWGAILLSESKQVAVGNSGAGYAAFALAMTIVRFMGDRFVARFGDRKALEGGAVLAAAGIALAAWADNGAVSIAGFAITGIGAANIVPVLFTLAGKQQVMPVGYAISAVSTLGYLGVFLGPGIVGHVAAWITLPLAFGVLALLMLVVAGMGVPVIRNVNFKDGKD